MIDDTLARGDDDAGVQREQVYGVEVGVEGHSRAEDGTFFARIEDADARHLVDDIWNGEIAFLTLVEEKEEVEFFTLTKLSPEDAKSLGKLLLRASEYAAEQREEMSDVE
jgi:hypothetical protein